MFEKNERNRAVIIIALRLTPLGTNWTATEMAMQKIGIIVKNNPIYTWLSSKSASLKANVGSIYPQRKYPIEPVKLASKYLLILSKCMNPMFSFSFFKLYQSYCWIKFYENELRFSILSVSSMLAGNIIFMKKLNIKNIAPKA